MAMNQSPFFNLPDKIEKFLGSSYCKRRDDQVSAPIKGLLNDRSQLAGVIRGSVVKSFAVGGFHDDVVSISRKLRIAD